MPTPPVRTTVNCYLCGTERPALQMSPIGSPALGHRVDFALSVDWLCPKPCFIRARDAKLTLPRIYAEHDAKERANRANLQAALQETESDHIYLATLPDGLRVTEPDIERVRYLDGDYCAEKLQDEETERAAFRLLRNFKQLPYCHVVEAGGRVEFWEYQELTERLENLERGAR